jgi:hypothetical protein
MERQKAKNFGQCEVVYSAQLSGAISRFIRRGGPFHDIQEFSYELQVDIKCNQEGISMPSSIKY